MQTTANGTPKARKRNKNLTLDSGALALAEDLRTQDHRPSLVNLLEHLVFEEAKRRGLTPALAKPDEVKAV
jgi:hypothetical protein